MKVEFLNDLTLNEIFILIGVSAVFGVMAHIAFEYLCDVYRRVKQKRSEKLGNWIVSDEPIGNEWKDEVPEWMKNLPDCKSDNENGN